MSEHHGLPKTQVAQVEGHAREIRLRRRSHPLNMAQPNVAAIAKDRANRSCWVIVVDNLTTAIERHPTHRALRSHQESP